MTYAKAKACFSSPPAARTRTGRQVQVQGGERGRGRAKPNESTHNGESELRQDKTSVSCVPCVDKARLALPWDIYFSKGLLSEKRKRDPQKAALLFLGGASSSFFSCRGALELPAGSQLCMRTSGRCQMIGAQHAYTCTHTQMHQYSRPCWIPPPSNHFLIMPAFTVHMSLPNNKTKLHCVQHNLQAVLAAFRAPPLPLPLGKHDRSQTSTPTCCVLIWKAIYDFSLFCRVLTAVGQIKGGRFLLISP